MSSKRDSEAWATQVEQLERNDGVRCYNVVKLFPINFYVIML